jgi:hypothetical protein
VDSGSRRPMGRPRGARAGANAGGSSREKGIVTWATPGGATGPLLWAGPRGNSVTFDLFKINSNTFELNQSEDGLPVLNFF